MSPLNQDVSQLSLSARQAVQAGNWRHVDACARQIRLLDKKNPEGHFLTGLVEKAAGHTGKAITAFARARSLDAKRYDAAIELAGQYALVARHGDALKLLQRYQAYLTNSPLYLDMAAGIYSRLGLHARAWPLYQKANELQPGVDRFQASLAACAVYLGKIDEAKTIYKSLLARYPNHQQNHYQLAGLEKARDAAHVEQMQEILNSTRLSHDKNIFLYYAIGKELEDLERWPEAFHYFKLAGDTVTAVANYDVDTDIQLIDKVIEVCSGQWLAGSPGHTRAKAPRKTPVFVVGLPRSGTTLTERIISSHSQVESVDETFLVQMTIAKVSGIDSRGSMSPAVIEAAAKKAPGHIASGYLEAVNYKLGDRPLFVDKLPENVLYLGFIARAFPDARIILLRRNPMDVCFAMYKQSFFKFAYTLENLGRYYVAFDRLVRHWQDVLKDRLIEVEYESLVADQELQTRLLLEKLGLDFEQACLDFDQNTAPSATASAVQVREKVHSRSVNKWKHFQQQLQPLQTYLENAGISVE